MRWKSCSHHNLESSQQSRVHGSNNANWTYLQFLAHKRAKVLHVKQTNKIESNKQLFVKMNSGLIYVNWPFKTIIVHLQPEDSRCCSTDKFSASINPTRRFYVGDIDKTLSVTASEFTTETHIKFHQVHAPGVLGSGSLAKIDSSLPLYATFSKICFKFCFRNYVKKLLFFFQKSKSRQRSI